MTNPEPAPGTTSRRGFLKLMVRLSAVGALEVAGGVAYTARIEPGWLDVERIQVPIAGLPPAFDGYRIVQLSDLHVRSERAQRMARRAVKAAMKQSPDLITITGDYVTDWVNQDALVQELSVLDAPDGIWTCMGNHDHWTNVEEVREVVADIGITELQNDSTPITRDGETIFLAGVDDIWERHQDLTRALRNIPEDATTILLAHEPDFADEVAPTGRVALQLSGHSHGGQIRFPFIGAPVLPYLGEKYPIGLRKLHDMYLYTNRGVGYLIPVRFNCRPEITEITLIRA